MSETIVRVRAHVIAGRVRVSEHGMTELTDDQIQLIDVIAGVASAVVIEDYPTWNKGPAVLCFQSDGNSDAIHVLWGLAALNPDVATIITAYRPDPARWEADMVTRRPK